MTHQAKTRRKGRALGLHQSTTREKGGFSSYAGVVSAEVDAAEPVQRQMHGLHGEGTGPEQLARRGVDLCRAIARGDKRTRGKGK